MQGTDEIGFRANLSNSLAIEAQQIEINYSNHTNITRIQVPSVCRTCLLKVRNIVVKNLNGRLIACIVKTLNIFLS